MAETYRGNDAFRDPLLLGAIALATDKAYLFCASDHGSVASCRSRGWHCFLEGCTYSMAPSYETASSRDGQTSLIVECDP